MRVFVAVLLVLFASGVGLLTYIAAGGKVEDLVGKDIASMLPTDLWIDFVGGGKDEKASPGTSSASISVDAGTGTGVETGAENSVGLETTAPAAGQQPMDIQTQIAGVDGTAALASDDEGPFRLGLPVDCVYGETCFIQNYVDMSAGDGYRDYQCGPLAYNRHRGTDFRVPSYVEMERGVNVVAAASGTVRAVRDGLPDANFKLFGRDAVNDRALGNVVVLDHKDGYKTFYGHMKRGSIRVEKGDVVQRGQALGQIGMSGLTEFPHLHLQVMLEKSVIDPFSGLGYEAGCGIEGDSLWLPEVRTQLDYLRTMILRIGFSNRELNKAAAEYDLFDKDRLSWRSKQFWFNAYVAGIGDGDDFTVRVTDPEGDVFLETPGRFDRPAAVHLIKIGKNPLEEPLKRGVYRAEFKYFKTADGLREELFDVVREIEVR